MIQKQGIRSYLIRMEEGSTYCRNRKHLNWIPETNHPETNDDNVPDDITDSPPVEPAIGVLPENSSTTQTQAESLLPHQTRSGRNV